MDFYSTFFAAARNRPTPISPRSGPPHAISDGRELEPQDHRRQQEISPADSFVAVLPFREVVTPPPISVTLPGMTARLFCQIGKS